MFMSLSRLTLRLLFERLLPAFFWFILAYQSYIALVNTIQSTNDLLVIGSRLGNCAFLLLVTTLFITRKRAVGSRARSVEALIAFAGTFGIWLLAFHPAVDTPLSLLIVANLLGLIGIIWSLFSLVSLGRCFGIFPEARGLITHGPYRLVRHPLYLGEILFSSGVALSYISPLSIGVWLVVVGFQVWRSLYEERALSKVFPEYAQYQRQTSFRLIPWAW